MLGGALALLTLLGLVDWGRISHAGVSVATCGEYRADWSDARAFTPACFPLGPPPTSAPPAAEATGQWSSDASKINYNDALQLQWTHPLGDWQDASGVRWGSTPIASSAAVRAVGLVRIDVPATDLRIVFTATMPAVGEIRCGDSAPLAQARIDPSTVRSWNQQIPSTQRVILVRCARPGVLSLNVAKVFSGTLGGEFKVYRNDPRQRVVDSTGLPSAIGATTDVVLDLRAAGWRGSLNTKPIEQALSNGMLLITVPTGGATGASSQYPIPKALRAETMFARYIMRIGNDWPATSGGKYPGLANTGATVRSGGIAAWGGRKADGIHWSARTMRANPAEGPWTGSYQGWGTYVYRLNYETLNGDTRWSTRPLPKGEFVVIDQMVKLNGVDADGTPRADGEVAYWLNGELVDRFPGIIFRNQTTPDTLPETFWIDVYVGGTGYVAPYPHTVLLADVLVSTKRLPFDPLVLARLNANARQTPGAL
jgi:hypothetical protein